MYRRNDAGHVPAPKFAASALACVLIVAIVLPVLVPPSAHAAASATETPPTKSAPPSTSAAPKLPTSATLVADDEPGAPFQFDCRVLDREGRPVRNARVYVYHADAEGRYVRHRTPTEIGGLVRTDALGTFHVRTVLPGPAEGNPHLHFFIELSPTDYRMGTFNFARHHGAGSDTSYAKLPWMLELPDASYWRYVEPGVDGAYHCTCDYHVADSPPSAERPKAFDRAAAR